MGSRYDVIHTMRKGALVGFENDEVGIVITDEDWRDATKMRIGSRDPGGWLLCLSGDLQAGDVQAPDLYEKGKIGLCHDDNFPKDVEAYCWRFFLQMPGGRDDATDKVVAEFTSQYIEFFGRRFYYNDRQQDDFAAGVTHLYVTLLTRQPESLAVIETWRQSSGGNLDVVRQGILGSEEYRATHP